jgi:hypothetical protein
MIERVVRGQEGGGNRRGFRERHTRRRLERHLEMGDGIRAERRGRMPATASPGRNARPSPPRARRPRKASPNRADLLLPSGYPNLRGVAGSSRLRQKADRAPPAPAPSLSLVQRQIVSTPRADLNDTA